MSMMVRRSPLLVRRAWPLAALLAAVLVATACTSAGATPLPSASAPASIAVLPSPASPSPTASAKPSPSPKVTQTDTGWGRIWDAVPTSFPLPAGAAPVAADRPASGAWSLASGDAATVTNDLKAALEAAGYTTAGVDGPLEDGSRIIDSVGKPAACHVQTRVAPLGTTIAITVLFGAACPFR